MVGWEGRADGKRSAGAERRRGCGRGDRGEREDVKERLQSCRKERW